MLKILIIDDNPTYRVALRAGLEKAGYQVLDLEQGGEAVVVAQTWRPDAILLDLDLPDVAGPVVCAQLKARPPTARIPVIIATGRGGESDRIGSFEAGADAFVTKPFTIRELDLRLRVLISHGRAN